MGTGGPTSPQASEHGSVWPRRCSSIVNSAFELKREKDKLEQPERHKQAEEQQFKEMMNYLGVFNRCLHSRLTFPIGRREECGGNVALTTPGNSRGLCQSPGPGESVLLSVLTFELPGHCTLPPRRKAAGPSFPSCSEDVRMEMPRRLFVQAA